MKTALDLLAADQARTQRAAASLALDIVRTAAAAPAPVAKSGGEIPVADFLRGASASPSGGAGRTLSAPYAQSAWVRAAVEAVANPISGRPLKFYDGENEFLDRGLAAFWEAPALGPKTAGGIQPRLSLAEVLRDLASWDRLEGEYFIVLDGAWLLATAPRAGASLPPFLIAHPGRMAAIVSGGELQGWRYSDAGGRAHTFIPEQVIHKKAFNPYDDWRGLGGLQAARVAAEGAFLTGTYVRDLARNNGDQGMVVIAKNGILTEPQRDQILTSLRAKRAALLRGEVKDILLGGDITVDRPKEQAASPELMSSAAMSHEEVFIAFGVPPSLAAVKAAYSIGKESDKYQLITETCQPVGGRIAGGLARVASRQAGRVLSAELDWDDHPVMIEVRLSRIETLGKLCDRGMPVKDGNAYLGLGMKPFPGWDVGYMPFSVAPVSTEVGSPLAGAPVDPAKDETLAETEPQDDALKTLKLLVLARSRAQAKPVARTVTRDEFADFCCHCSLEDGWLPSRMAVEQKGRSEKELARWKSYMAARRSTVASFKSAFGRVLMQARVEVLRKIEAGYTPAEKSVATKSAALDFLFSLEKFAASFRGAMQNQHKTALQKAGDELFAELGQTDPFKSPPAAVTEFLQERENKLKDVPQATFDRIKASLQAGLDAGDTTAELAGRVKAEFNGITDGQARTIAQTETAAAYGSGRAQAMEAAGVQWKQWLTSGNATVRAAHADANGQTVPVDEPFIVDGEALMHPGDTAGSAGNVINCHCVSIAVANGPEDAA